MASNSPPPVYLVELHDPHLTTFDKADVTVFLENAIQAVFDHLTDFAEPVEAQVTIDVESGDLAGIVFYTEEAAAIAVIRPFYLHREESECTDAEILHAAAGKLSGLEKTLNRIFER